MMMQIDLTAGQSGERALLLLDENTRAMQAITAEVGDYAQRFVADGTQTFTEVVRAASVSDAMGRLVAFNKRAAEEYVQQMARLSNMYAAMFQQQAHSAQVLMVAAPC